ncbi:MAG: hypothetical protein A2Y17_08560 [Clostridiales bacterium GWF2_38_85]|nr:MAG: hypothetical protein A2Y17_08560 [Clostridiales bacterium GWF2_38_85]HBL83754.1 arginine-binding protein [Clostridiales bacterium]
MKKFLAILLVFTFVLSFAGCDGDTTNTSSAADTSGSASVTESENESTAVSDTESTTAVVLKVATNAEFAPWEFIDDNQEIAGFDIDLVNAIGEKLNMTIEFSDMPFESVVASIPTDACDIAASGLTINETRLQAVDFSEPYFDASQILIVKSDDAVFTGTTKDDIDAQLVGKKIGVCTNFTGEAYANGDEDWKFPGIADAEVKSYANISLAITDLLNGNVDVIIMDNTVAELASKDNDSIKIVDVALTTETYGIAIKKGNTELKEKIDNAIQELKDEGFIDSLLAKWLS